MKNTEILKEYYRTMESHDWARMRALLCDDLKFRGPIMEANGADPLITAIREFACDVHFSEIEILEIGDTAMSFFTFKVAKPFTGTFRMAERTKFRDGKIAASELIYDPREFPTMN
jgi:ketosteroid isomerase-like protein